MPEGEHVLGELELLVLYIRKIKREINAIRSLCPLDGGGVYLRLGHFVWRRVSVVSVCARSSLLKKEDDTVQSSSTECIRIIPLLEHTSILEHGFVLDFQ